MTSGPGPSPPPSSETVARRFRGQPRRDTAHELAVRRRLHARGVRYRVDVRPCAATRARGDLVWKGRRLVVFLDGCFWHACPECGHVPHANREWWVAKLASNAARDRRADAVLRVAGWRVLRFWEHEDPDAVADAICAALGRPPEPSFTLRSPPPAPCPPRELGRTPGTPIRQRGQEDDVSMWTPMEPNLGREADGIPAADPGAGAPQPADGFGVGGEEPDRPEEDQPQAAGGSEPDGDPPFRTPDPDDVSRERT